MTTHGIFSTGSQFFPGWGFLPVSHSRSFSWLVWRSRSSVFVYLTRETNRNRALWEEITPHLQAGNFRHAAQLAGQSDSNISTVLKYGLSRNPVGAASAMTCSRRWKRACWKLCRRSRSARIYLSSLANIGMLIGPARHHCRSHRWRFSAVSSANPAEKASLLASAISVAMNNTASGPVRRDHVAACSHVSRRQDDRARRQPRESPW